MKVLIVFYSTYGHIFKMAEAVAEGVKEVAGAEVKILRVPETLPEEVLGKMGAVDAQKAFSHVPVCTVDELAEADAIIFGTPTRFGNMCGQMRQFLDATGQLWAKGSSGWQSGKCLCQQCHPARRPGIYDSHLSCHPAPSGICHCGPALCVSGTDANR